MRTVFFKSILFIGVFCLLVGCKKKKEGTDKPVSSSLDTNLVAARDEIYAESFYDDACTMGEELSTGSLNLFRNRQNTSPLCGCASIFYDTLNHWKSITVNFGTFFCLNSDGRNRRGSVVICWPSHTHYRDSGNTVSIAFDHYFVDNNSVDGTILITNMGHVAGMRTWQVSVNGTIVFANSADTLSWRSNRIRRLLSGEIQNNTDVDWTTAKIGTTGTANGTCASGVSFTSSITSELIRDFSCSGYYRFFSQGKLDLSPANKPPQHIDFGNGSCDDAATITIGSYAGIFTMI